MTEFEFLRIFEDTMAEVALDADPAICEEVRRRVVLRVLREWQNSHRIEFFDHTLQQIDSRLSALRREVFWSLK